MRNLNILSIGTKKKKFQNYRLKLKINLIFGHSGTVGQSIYKSLKGKKNYFFSSRSKSKGTKKWDLNKNLNTFPIKKVDTCFFFSSPKIIKKNFKKEIFNKEYIWLKNVISNIKIDRLIYLSSSSVYYEKTHVIGKAKRKCEKYILNNKSKFINYQIWRPFNLVGSSYSSSDHFYNILFRKMFIEKKSFYSFKGNINDKRGYSSVDEFTKVMLKYSKIKKNFIKDFGNPKLIKISEIINLFNKKYFQLNKKYFKFEFLSNKRNINKIKINKGNVYCKSDTIRTFKNYLRNSFNVKKV